MYQIALVAGGGVLGAVSRFTLSRAIHENIDHPFAFGTLAVNLTGCFMIGLVFELFDQSFISKDLRTFLMVGFLGAYTTFSSYSLETLQLLRDGHLKLGVLNVLLSNFLGLIMVVVGMYCARLVLRLFH